MSLEFFIDQPTTPPVVKPLPAKALDTVSEVTAYAERLKKFVETPMELSLLSARGLGVIDGQTVADRAAAKLDAEALPEPNPVLLDEMAPMLEIEMPQVQSLEDKLATLTPNQSAMTQRAMADPGDPTVLLQGLLGQMPGMNHRLAADMAMGTDVALHNLGAKAERMAMMDEREARREARARAGGGGKGRRRR